MNRRRLLLLLLLLLLGTTAWAGPVPPLEALEQLRKGFAAMDDFTAEIAQEKQLAILQKKLLSTGTVRFKKPDLFFMELNPPHGSKLVLRDKSMEIFFPEDKTRQQLVLPMEQGLKHWLDLLARPITTLPAGSGFKAERTRENLTLTITPEKKGQVQTITITSGSDGRPRKLVIEERNGNRTAITFQKLRANVGLREKDFKIE
jgi:outer membrane lipoprotein carrier protein